MCVKEGKCHHGEGGICRPLWHWLSLKAATPCRVPGLLQLSDMADLLFTSSSVCLSKMENSKEGVLLFPPSENAEQGSTFTRVTDGAGSLQSGCEPGLRKFTSDRYILPLSLLGTGMAESQWVIPSVPWSQDYFLPRPHNGFFQRDF